MTAEDEPQEQQAAVEERQEGSMMIEEPLNEPRSEKSKETPVEPRDETAENSSESSSEGKSGSGGGYSADCSASDQSSDEKTAENGGMKVSIERLSLRDEHKRSQRKGRKKKSSHNKEHYSSPGKADSLEKDSDENDDYDDVDEDNHALHQKPPASSDIQALATDIAALQSQMQRWYQENALMLQGNGPLPQWNGVRIAHPMDPRIDLSTVSHVALQPGVPVNLQLNSTNQTAQTLPAHGPPTGNERTDGAPEHFGLPTMESYMHLMEVSLYKRLFACISCHQA